jgi:hypothetical protein
VKNLQVANEAYLVPHQIRWIPDTWTNSPNKNDNFTQVLMIVG